MRYLAPSLQLIFPVGLLLFALSACNTGPEGKVTIRYQKMAVFTSLDGSFMRNGQLVPNSNNDTALTNQGCCYYVYRILAIENNQPGAADFLFQVNQLKDTKTSRFAFINTDNLNDVSNAPYVPIPLKADTAAYQRLMFKDVLVRAGETVNLKHHRDFVIFVQSDLKDIDLTNNLTLTYTPVSKHGGKTSPLALVSTNEESARVGVKLPLNLSEGMASNVVLDDLLKK